MGEGTLSREKGESTLFTGHVPGIAVVQARVDGIVVAGRVEVIKTPSVLTSLDLKSRWFIADRGRGEYTVRGYTP